MAMKGYNLLNKVRIHESRMIKVNNEWMRKLSSSLP